MIALVLSLSLLAPAAAAGPAIEPVEVGVIDQAIGVARVLAVDRATGRVRIAEDHGDDIEDHVVTVRFPRSLEALQVGDQVLVYYEADGTLVVPAG